MVISTTQDKKIPFSEKSKNNRLTILIRSSDEMKPSGVRCVCCCCYFSAVLFCCGWCWCWVWTDRHLLLGQRTKQRLAWLRCRPRPLHLSRWPNWQGQNLSAQESRNAHQVADEAFSQLAHLDAFFSPLPFALQNDFDSSRFLLTFLRVRTKKR